MIQAHALAEFGPTKIAHVTAALMAAYVAEHGLREESCVDGCDSEARDRNGEWHRCVRPGDHEGDHQNDYVPDWPWDEVDGPPKHGQTDDAARIDLAVEVDES